eukprot:gene10441-biopygen10825
MNRLDTWAYCAPPSLSCRGRNGCARVRSASVSLNSIVRPASGPRPLPFPPGVRVRGSKWTHGDGHHRESSICCTDDV